MSFWCTVFYSCSKDSTPPPPEEEVPEEEQPEEQDTLQNHLLAYYPFSGNVLDESGNNNNLVVNGATLTSDRFNKANTAYSFNGIDQTMTIPSFSVDSALNGFTISLWAKPEQTNSGYILSFRKDSNNDCPNSIWIENNPAQYNVRCNFSTSFQPENFCSAALLYKTIQEPVNKWIHIVMVVDPVKAYNKQFHLYVDGEKVSSGSMKLEPTTFKDGGIIGAPFYNADFYKGAIDDIRIYDTNLSEAQVTVLYTSK